LPEGFADGLRFFLQAAGTAYARRYRTGIAIDRAALAEGVRQAVASVELGLEAAASGDLDEAVRRLEGVPFESLRKSGYEIAWQRLGRMRDGSRAAAGRRELSLLGPAWRDLKRWSEIVPDTWQVPRPEDKDESPAVDPIADFARYEMISGQLAFLAHLPSSVLKGLQASGGSVAFEEVLRRIIPPLALGKPELGRAEEMIAAFRDVCCRDGALRPEVGSELLQLLDRHLKASVTDERVRGEIRVAFEAELSDLVREANAADANASGDGGQEGAT
jgi:hypothetical protein